MSFFDDAILEGVWRGIVKGFYDHGILIREAETFLRRDEYSASDPKERGIREGLIDVGLLKRSWIGRVRRASKRGAA